MESTTASWLLAACVAVLAGQAGAITFDFDDPALGFEHGSVVSDQYQGLGLRISAQNLSDGPDYAVIFDTRLSDTRDPDLEYGPGNLHGNILIVQENSTGCGDGICDRPDDEGARPAGIVTFDFDAPIRSFGLDLFDIEALENAGSLRFYSSQAGGGYTQVGPTVYFSDFADPSSPFFLLGVVFGDNSANQIDPISAQALGAGSFDRVSVHFGGSGGLDALRVEEHQVVPEPATLPMLGAGLIGLTVLGRRRPSARRA